MAKGGSHHHGMMIDFTPLLSLVLSFIYLAAPSSRACMGEEMTIMTFSVFQRRTKPSNQWNLCITIVPPTLFPS